MLKKIAVSQLRVGMFLERLEGRWIDHPFWRSRFVIDSPAQLAQLRDSSVRECWIDSSRGLDVADAPAVAAAATAAAAAAANPAPAPTAARRLPAATAAAAAAPGRFSAPTPPPARPPSPTPTHAMGEELRQAAAICQRARTAVVAMFGEARMGRAISTDQCAALVEEVTSSVFRNPDALVSLARLKTRDDYTYLHSVAVCALMVSLGRQIGLDEDACRQAGLAGLVHDIGKAAMPLEVLNKPGKLTENEFQIMRAHPVRGHEMLSETAGATQAMLDVALYHHERMDGKGYPQQLAEGGLSQVVRMGAICDVYDAITSNRPYKAGWDPGESIARMASWSGHFDPTLFAAFVRGLGIYPVGSLVKLASGKLAVVVEQNPLKPVTPRVKVFFSTSAQMPLTPQLLDLSRSADRIVGRQERKPGEFPHLDAMWAGEALPRSA